MLYLKCMRALALAVVAGGSAGLAPAAHALTFDLAWSGAPYGNGATATGLITVGDTLPLIGTGFGAAGLISVPSSQVTALSITIAGAKFGNGTFGAGQIGAITFETPAPLDLSRQLVGQDLGNGHRYAELGSTGLSGDFNLFGDPSTGAPIGTNWFTFTTAAQQGDSLMLVSMMPEVVPEPTSLALLALSLLGVGIMQRKRG